MEKIIKKQINELKEKIKEISIKKIDPDNLTEWWEYLKDVKYCLEEISVLERVLKII